MPPALADGLDGRGQPEVGSARSGQQPGMAAKYFKRHNNGSGVRMPKTCWTTGAQNFINGSECQQLEMDTL